MRRFSFIIPLVLGCFLLVPSGTRAASGTTTHPAASNTPHARVSDAELESKIHAKLAKSKIGKDGFTVSVKGGVVTWEGQTSVIQHKGAATRMARTSGAVEVVNHIKIGDGAAGTRRVQVKPN